MDQRGLITDSTVDAILKRDRITVVIALCATIVVSWLYVFAGAGMGMPASEMSSWSMAIGNVHSGMAEMNGPMATMATPAAWDTGYATLIFFMWWVMMIAMMLPSAAPTVLLYNFVARKAQAKADGDEYRSSSTAFVIGYLLVWAVFSAIATMLQYGFEQAGILSPSMLNSTSVLFAGSILIFAGIYQLSPLKQACLNYCRGPIEFLSRNWHTGIWGAFRMGAHHGAYCLGCCWGLMMILFFGGIMNLYWIIGLAVLVFLEKLTSFGVWLSRFLGIALISWGCWFLATAFQIQ